MPLALTVLFALVLVVAFVHAPRDHEGRRPALSCYTIVLALFAVYVLLPAILIIANGGQYTWAWMFASDEATSKSLALCLGALVTFIYTNSFFRKISPRSAKALKESVLITPKTAQIIALALVVIGLLIKVYFVVTSGGLEQTVQRLSGSVRESSGLSQVSEDAIGLRTISGVADGAAVWIFLEQLRTKKKLIGPSVLLIVVLASTYVTMGKRLGLLWPVMAVAVGIHVYRRYIPLKAFPLGATAFLAVTMGALFFRIFAPASLAGVGVDLNQISYAGGSLLSFYFYSLEFSTVEMISVVMARRNDMDQMLGGGLETFVNTNLTPFTYVIPRAIWPQKPEMYYDASYAVSATLLGQNIDGSTAGFASTLIGTGYLIGGLVGSLFALALLGYLVARVDQMLLISDWSVGRVLLYSFMLVVSFHLFRQGSAAWTFIISVVQQLGFILGIFVPLLFSWSKRARYADPNSQHALQHNFERSR